jgi:uncharacterized membrane protein
MPSQGSANTSTSSWAGFLAGAGIGAACMFLIDRNNGARRRAFLRRTARARPWVAGAAAMLSKPATGEASPLTRQVPTRRAVYIEKTLHVRAPIATVFDFWTNLDNFPHLRHVLEARSANVERLYHFGIAGGNVPVGFNVFVTRFEPNRLLAWKTVHGSAVAHAGVICFESDEAEGTWVHIQFACKPPAGASGLAISALFGNDPKAKMDAILANMKTTIEAGNSREPVGSGQLL